MDYVLRETQENIYILKTAQSILVRQMVLSEATHESISLPRIK